jgi:hypothetical protein
VFRCALQDWVASVDLEHPREMARCGLCAHLGARTIKRRRSAGAEQVETEPEEVSSDSDGLWSEDVRVDDVDQHRKGSVAGADDSFDRHDSRAGGCSQRTGFGGGGWLLLR